MSRLQTQKQFEADLKNLAVVRRWLAETATVAQVPPDVLDAMILAVDEALTNVIAYGVGARAAQIDIALEIDATSFTVWVRDDAAPFDPTQVPPPDVTLPLEQRPVGGLGIHLIRQCVDEMRYRVRLEGGNELTLICRWPSS